MFIVNKTTEAFSSSWTIVNNIHYTAVKFCNNFPLTGNLKFNCVKYNNLPSMTPPFIKIKNIKEIQFKIS